MGKKTKTKRSIGPAGASIVSDDGMRIKTKKSKEKEEIIERFADGGEVKGYMGGGEVHMDDSPNSGLITTKGWGKSRAT